MALDGLTAIISLVIGFLLGYLFSQYLTSKNTDISQKSAMLQSLTSQVTEMKAKFDAYEKLREQKEKDYGKIQEQKEKRYAEFMKATQNFFDGQEKMRISNEEKRDGQMDKFSSIIDAFNRTIHGTTSRGKTGEELLRTYLNDSIKAGIIKAPLRTENGEIEFAWNLGDGKYIPIDSKLPELMKTIDLLDDVKEHKEKTKIRNEVKDKILNEIEKVTKYQNLSNTVNKCILVVPKIALDLVPEIIDRGGQKNVFVCSHEEVFLVGYIISEEYDRLRKEGNLGQLKEVNKKLIAILKEIMQLTDTIERQSKSVLKHNESIRDTLQKGLRL